MKTRQHRKLTAVFMGVLAIAGILAAMPLSAGEPRFIVFEVSGQKIVRDRATGLEWTEQCAPDVTWQEALAHCEGLNYGGHTDWRLPNVRELSELLNPDALEEWVFQGFDWYSWSSTTAASRVSFAWVVSVGGAEVFFRSKLNNYNAGCVRGES